ncbi:MAG: COR domain-containing protein [Cyanobacteria bacterium J06597_16]
MYEKAPLHFRYRYDILPGSIISRFIVRNHTMIYKNMRWRSGAVLHQDLNKALVRADEEDNFISIKVEGSRASALLAAIRADFDKIHKTIKLPVRERLVVKEIQNAGPTGREVPVDYNYLCELERNGIGETSLPDLRGKYNIRDLLEGVEPQTQRQDNLDDRLARSRSSRSSRPLDTLEEKSQPPSFFKTSIAMLVVLAVVTAIFAVLAHFVPALQLVVIVIAILLTFSILTVFALRITGTIKDDVFGKALSEFWKVVPRINGAKSEQEGNETTEE